MSCTENRNISYISFLKKKEKKDSINIDNTQFAVQMVPTLNETVVFSPFLHKTKMFPYGSIIIFWLLIYLFFIKKISTDTIFCINGLKAAMITTLKNIFFQMLLKDTSIPKLLFESYAR